MRIGRVKRMSVLSVVFVTGLLVFSSCQLWSRHESVITEKEYETMITGAVKDVSDLSLFFPKSVADVKKRTEFAIAQATKGLETIKSLGAAERTFENTARAFDKVEASFSVVSNGIHITEMVHGDKEMRDACHDAVIQLSGFAVDAFLHPDLYKAVKEYMAGNMRKEALSAEEKYFLDEAIKGFKRAGLHLSDVKLSQVKVLQKKLTKLSMEFSRNVATDKSSIAVDREALSGLEDHFIENLDKNDEGKYLLKCDYPTYFEVMKHCDVRSTRRQLLHVFNNRAYPKNKPVFEAVIALRDELSKMLGYKSYAHYDIGNQMAKDPEKVETFIKELAQKVEAKERVEFERLASDLPVGVALTGGKFDPCDVAYTKEAYKKKNFDIDDREIAEYFPMEKTVAGIFSIYQKFLGLTFKLSKPDNLWHKDVSVIEVYKKGLDVPEGYIFLDLYPRDDKYSHACAAEIMSPIFSRDDSSNQVPSIVAIIANFPKSTKDRPSLLKHSDVETFFHEFGHAIHQVLGRTELNTFAGFETKTDFVEVPSQMFEEWMWDKDMLKMVSGHFKTGKSLPESLIDKMIELKRFDSGSFVSRQCCLASMSLAYFKEGAKKDVDKILREYNERYIKHIRFEPSTHMYAAWGHLTGYGAKYYSYQWSKVFSLDLFDTIRKHGLLNPEIGNLLIEKVLGKGGSVEPATMLKDFLGREPNQEAYLKDIGVEV